MSVRTTTTIPPTIYETFTRRHAHRVCTSPLAIKSPAAKQASPIIQRRPIMATTTGTSGADDNRASFNTYQIQSAVPKSAQKLTPTQSLLSTSVLDLFAGFPTKRKLSLWTDDASFHDPLTIAEGRKQFEAQWYGLKATMSSIALEHAEVIDAGNPIKLKTKVRYQIKAVGKEQLIESEVLVHLTPDEEKIVKVEDRWGGEVPPDGVFAKAMRNLNSVTVPAFVRVPASIEEEEAAAKK